LSANRARLSSGAVPKVLIAADADWVINDVMASLGGPGTMFIVCHSGKDVVRAAIEHSPDLAVLDLQIGTMGGMAVCMALRLDETGGYLGHVPVLMLLDRKADVHLARRSGAEGWLIKPLDPLRLRRAATTILDGGTYPEGVPAEPPPSMVAGEAEPAAEAPESPPGEPATTG
jgi:DNA-binding response OmpR family regulator